VSPLGQFFLADGNEQVGARRQHCRDGEDGLGVVEVVRVLVVDEVAARLPERLPRADDALGFTLDLEAHLSGDEVAEDGAGVAVRRAARAAGRERDEHRRHVCGAGHVFDVRLGQDIDPGSVALTAFSLD
jgi:hypothetical protein